MNLLRFRLAFLFYLEKAKKLMTRSIVLTNQKGGVGKSYWDTTSTCETACNNAGFLVCHEKDV